MYYKYTTDISELGYMHERTKKTKAQKNASDPRYEMVRVNVLCMMFFVLFLISSYGAWASPRYVFFCVFLGSALLVL